MITAWVLYYDTVNEVYHLSELQGTSFESIAPEDWGLARNYNIVLVLHHASFMQAWIEGEQVKGY